MSSLPNDLKDIKKLTKIFEELGADNPEGWANSQITEGINQLGRYVILSEMWKCVIDKHDTAWIDEALKHANSTSHWNYKKGKLLKNMLEKGVSKQEIIDLVRDEQYGVLFDTAYIMDGPRNSSDLPEEIQDINWAIFQINEDGEPVSPIYGLHEDLLEMDPQKSTGPDSE